MDDAAEPGGDVEGIFVGETVGHELRPEFATAILI